MSPGIDSKESTPPAHATRGTLPREERGIGTKAIFPFKGNRLLISLSKRGFYIARHDIRRYETYFSSKISY